MNNKIKILLIIPLFLVFFVFFTHAITIKHTVIDNIFIGGLLQQIAVNPVTNLIYVVNLRNDEVAVIDGSNNSIITTISVGSVPRGVALNSFTNLVYVTNYQNDTVSVIDGYSNSVIETIPFSSIGSVDVNPITNFVYVRDGINDEYISVIDGGDNTVVDEIFVGCSPRDISVNEYTNHIYVANSPCGSISMIDGDTNEVEGVIALGSDPMSLDVSKTLDRVYVTDYFNNSLYVVDGFANSIITTIPVGSRPSGSGVKVNNLNDFIYVVNNTEGNVYVVDAKTNEVIDSISLAEENDGTEVAPGGIDINPQTNRIYVPYGDPGYVAVIACQFLISIDIKPGSYPNSINLKSRGKVPVAILTTDDFDAQYVDPETCVFAGAEPLRWNMIDLGRDGDVDMILHFKTQELNLNQNSTEASLVCEIYGGTQIIGTDSVSIVPKNKVGSKNLKK